MGYGNWKVPIWYDRYRPSKNNEVAGALSRRVYSENDKQVEDTVVASMSSDSKSDFLQNFDSDSNETEIITQVTNDISELTEMSFFYSKNQLYSLLNLRWKSVCKIKHTTKVPWCSVDL